ncbi:calumenin-B [Canna indica]|uniref:Calumenin-B n=1 Tax=Canna indica TaxID=4628 RepID=A0AAQ3KDZ5_9LILI|nr:calumenin-B [Canna indica]
MSRRVALYLLLAVAVLLLLSHSQSPRQASTPRHHQRNRRLAYHPHIVFDPLVTELEHRAEERGLLDFEAFKHKMDTMWEKKDWSKMADEVGVLEEYFGEEGRLNLTERLTYLFPLLDRFPQDGGISFHELQVWVQRQAIDRLFRQTERRLKIHDADGDGAVSLLEFLSYAPDEKIDWSNMENGKPGWWKEQFSNADLDGNGSLNSSELNNFLHPEDSLNPKVMRWLLQEKLRELDEDKDGKLSFKEFNDKSDTIYRTFPEYEDHIQHQLPNVKEEFKKLDINKDNYLRAEELRPLLRQLYPGELSHSTHFAKYLMDKADENKDGKLTLEEMLQQQYAFYSTVYEEQYIDDDDYYDFHDELRR